MKTMLVVPVKAAFLNKGKLLLGVVLGWIAWAMLLADPLEIYSITVDKNIAHPGEQVLVTTSSEKPVWASRLCVATSGHNHLRDRFGQHWQFSHPVNYNDGSLKAHSFSFRVPDRITEGPALVWRTATYRCFGGWFTYSEVPHRSDWATIYVEKR